MSDTCLDPDFPDGGWQCDTDPDMGDSDDIYDDADDPNDFDTPLSAGEAIMDDDAVYTTDDNGCSTGCEATIFCYTDGTTSPPKTKKKRKARITLRHLPPLKRRIKKVVPKPIKSGGDGSG